MSQDPPGKFPNMLRSSLLAVLKAVDPVEAARLEPGAGIGRLLELVRSCRPLPPKFVHWVTAQVNGGQAQSAGNRDEALADWNTWLSGNGFAALGSVHDATPTAEPVQATITPPPVGPCLPREWHLLVADTRARLLEPIPQAPFSQWMLPQPLWRASWTDAHAVISSDERATVAATALVPSDDAGVSLAAQDAWRARVSAANRLSANPVRTRAAILCRILDCAPAATPSYVVIERLREGPRTLAERLRSADTPTPAQVREFAIALCDMLTALAAANVSIMDLRPEFVAFEHSEGLRLTQLLDPTAVCPLANVIPELRTHGPTPAAGLLDQDDVERAQVFLVAALALGVLRNTAKFLEVPAVGRGRCASFAALAGAPELADADPDRIVQPLIADIRRTYIAGPDWAAAETLVSQFRWALSEEPDERHQSPAALAASLRGASRG